MWAGCPHPAFRSKLGEGTPPIFDPKLFPTMRSFLLAPLGLLLALAAAARADITLPKIFGDGMVLQRELPVPVWGKAAAGEDVTVRFAGQEKKTKADSAGAWHVTLDPLKASAEPRA